MGRVERGDDGPGLEVDGVSWGGLVAGGGDEMSRGVGKVMG